MARSAGTNYGFRSAALVVDTEPRQDLRRMPRDRIVSGVDQMRTHLPDNRLARHLEHCALTYGCPAGKNFFLGRYEAPLPTSRACNARCLGCISFQHEARLNQQPEPHCLHPDGRRDCRRGPGAHQPGEKTAWSASVRAAKATRSWRPASSARPSV